MNPESENLLAPVGTQTPAPETGAELAPAASTQGSGANPIQPKSIVGDHFFWASGAILLDLS